MKDLTRLCATDALSGLRRGDFSALDLMRACLARIRHRDPQVRAWLCLNPSAEAEAAQIKSDDPRPLAGLPVGVKDVFATAQMPTTYNSPLFQNHHPATDAAVVAILRNAGAIIIGKTDTTEFAAAGRNAATGNPAMLSHSPGGSSAGSAAAVADFHVPVAVSTQTGGSTIRPASFCGVFAIKPSFGLISTEGLKPYAPSLDTVGFHARALCDLDLIARVFSLPQTDIPARTTTFGLCRTPYKDRLSAPMAALLDRAGLIPEVVPFDLPPAFADLDQLHHTLMFAEGATSFLPLARNWPDELNGDFHTRVSSRNTASMRAAFGARDRLAALAIQLENLMASHGVDALIAPAAPGTAPLGRSPGDPVFNALWTALQMPCVALPCGLTDGLPMGLQLVGLRAGEGALLKAAAAIAPKLATMEEPIAPA